MREKRNIAFGKAKLQMHPNSYRTITPSCPILPFLRPQLAQHLFFSPFLFQICPFFVMACCVFPTISQYPATVIGVTVCTPGAVQPTAEIFVSANNVVSQKAKEERIQI